MGINKEIKDNISCKGSHRRTVRGGVMRLVVYTGFCKCAVYSKVYILIRKGIAGMPYVTHCNCGYLMQTTPHMLL